MDILLTEKYRPKELCDVIGNKDTIGAIQNLLDYDTIPHLCFTGRPGTGKTTVAKIISKKLLKDPKNLLELNASDERGIDTVRTTIKNFTLRKTNGIKVIILDECDSMTSAAQQAMRRTMEMNTHDSRFILICNDIKKVTEPIQSRCAIYLSDRIPDEELKLQLQNIAKKENIAITDEALNMTVFLSNNDMRQAINILQSAVYLEKIDEESILTITGQPSPKMIEKIILFLIKKENDQAFNLFDQLWLDGFDSQDLISSFFKVAKNMDNYDLLKIISHYQYRFSEGTGSKLQFYSLMAEIYNID